MGSIVTQKNIEKIVEEQKKIIEISNEIRKNSTNSQTKIEEMVEMMTSIDQINKMNYSHNSAVSMVMEQKNACEQILEQMKNILENGCIANINKFMQDDILNRRTLNLQPFHKEIKNSFFIELQNFQTNEILNSMISEYCKGSCYEKINYLFGNEYVNIDIETKKVDYLQFSNQYSLKRNNVYKKQNLIQVEIKYGYINLEKTNLGTKKMSYTK